jgi:serine/threonine protein kinase
MTPERWQQIEELYHAALERAADERSSFLGQACGGDQELRREVESLLASHDRAGTFIESSPDDVAAGMIAEEQARSMLGRTLGHYRIRSLLGAGGMGEVYRARDLRLDRDVAVKILPEDLADHPDALKRFEREAKAVAALSHPNILSIFDFGTEENLSYAVMELLEGETLRERLNRAPMDWREAIEIGVAIAEGLSAAHEKGIIHRDLKPENLFLTSNAGVKILDFGIARVKHTVLPEAETLSGTGPVQEPSWAPSDICRRSRCAANRPTRRATSSR